MITGELNAGHCTVTMYSSGRVTVSYHYHKSLPRPYVGPGDTLVFTSHAEALTYADQINRVIAQAEGVDYRYPASGWDEQNRMVPEEPSGLHPVYGFGSGWVCKEGRK